MRKINGPRKNALSEHDGVHKIALVKYNQTTNLLPQKSCFVDHFERILFCLSTKSNIASSTRSYTNAPSGMHDSSRWKERLGPTLTARTIVLFTHLLISTIVGLTTSCNPTPGKIHRAKSDFGTNVPEDVDSPVKKVTKTSRKTIAFTMRQDGGEDAGCE